MTMIEIIAAMLLGALGALAQEIRAYGRLERPRIQGRYIYPGTLGMLCLGAIAGVITPPIVAIALPSLAGQPLAVALIAGYLGPQCLDLLAELLTAVLKAYAERQLSSATKPTLPAAKSEKVTAKGESLPVTRESPAD
jgi:TRAP-type C4-dicarboxylate transport system permease large subunit